MPDKRAPDQAGFTLLEMIVVLVVLALMAGLVLARGPQRSAALELRMAAGEVAQALRGARGRAIATNGPVVFRLDVGAHEYRVDGAPPRALPASLALSMVAIAGEVTDSQIAGISFSPDGSSSGGRVELASGARRVQVGVDWLTGRVRVADGSAEAPR